MIEGGGHTALPEVGGADTWDALRDGGFDLVLTDLRMPSLDGATVARWLERYRPGTPVIAISGALGDMQDTEREPPFAAALHRPVNRDIIGDDRDCVERQEHVRCAQRTGD
jgi:CheY-like chemotaxis protein